jgi:hypothetical protein
LWGQTSLHHSLDYILHKVPPLEEEGNQINFGMDNELQLFINAHIAPEKQNLGKWFGSSVGWSIFSL